MHVMRVRNVNDAWPQAVTLIKSQGRKQPSRSGDVLVLDEPVMTEYMFPLERVLLCPVRDANPFFHLMESLWMLAGRRDVKWLDQFVKGFSERYGEEDGLSHGTYGYRWKNHFSYDQLYAIINRLRANPDDRRICIAMWDVNADLYDPAELDETTDKPFIEPKDIPCNTHIYFRIVGGTLDMTVMCRSNDIVWGAYGANVVHMSMLHEYMSAMIGAPVGIYRQFSNNYHAYLGTLPNGVSPFMGGLEYFNDYEQGGLVPSRLVHNTASFDQEVEYFIVNPSESSHNYDNWFLKYTAVPMYTSYMAWKAGQKDDALTMVSSLVQASDWKEAAKQWMLRRINK